MSPDEQFATLDTPEWLAAFRNKVGEIEAAMAKLGARSAFVEFDVSGVPCRVTPGDRVSIAQIGHGVDEGSWQLTINAPTGWFSPSVPAPVA